MKTSIVAIKSILFYIRTFTVLFCCFNILKAQKPSDYSNRLEINKPVQGRNYTTEYGKTDRTSGVLRYIYQEKYNADQLTPQATAREYLLLQAERFGISSLPQELQLLREVNSPAGQQLIYQQQIQGIPVYNSGIILTIDDQNTVTFVSSTFRPKLKVADLRAAISSRQAVQFAEKYLGNEYSISAEPEADLMIFNPVAAEGVLVYRIKIIIRAPRGDWELLVDAVNGTIWQARNLLRFQTGSAGRGLLWDPDPLSSARVYYGGFFIDNNDADAAVLNSQREPVILNDLKHENGKYYLQGPYVKLEDIDHNPVDIFPVLSDSSAFNFTRHQQEFEDVMVYYNLDRAGRYLNYLGCNIDSLLAFRADPHGLNGSDNSYYSPFENNCVFGEGGVDDGEDADVIWHEFAHAIMAQIHFPLIMNYDGETAALEEGSADYWAASNSRAVSDFAWGQLFLWDAGIGSAQSNPGIFWAGRRCDLDWHYPEDYDFAAVKEHNNGQIWSSALMHIWSDLGREITDRLFIQAIYLWGTSPDLHDAAQAFVQADRLLYDGQHFADIVYWFEYHGLIDPGQSFPVINHEPLADSEDLTGHYTVPVEIIPAVAPLDPNNLWLVWGHNGIFSDSLLLMPTAEPNVFAAEIPGAQQAVSINYYITAADSAGYFASDPGRAPLAYYSFNVGPDLQAPVLVHTPLQDQSFWRWPAVLNVRATDNVGIAEVQVYYSLNQTGEMYSIQLTPAQVPGWFSGAFALDTSQVEIGDTVHYMIQTRDKAIAGNSTVTPQSGYYSFAITGSGGEIVFDFEADNGGMAADGDWQWGKPVSGPRAALSGENLWATKLDGNYSNGPLLSTLVLPVINLQGFNVAALQLWQWYDIIAGGDGGNVKVSADDGLSWQVLQPLFGYAGTTDTLSGNPLQGEQVFFGNSAGWIKTFFNLDFYVKQSIQIKFEFGADAAVTGFGWYIDSVAIVEKSVKLSPPGQLTVLDNHDYVKLGWNYLNIFKTSPGANAVLQNISEQPEENLLWPDDLMFKVYRQVDSLHFNLIGQTAQYSFTDSLVNHGHSYTYYLTSQVGSWESEPSDTIEVTVQAVIDVQNETTAMLPQAYALHQNYPNPFNPVTSIKYQLRESCQVRLLVYDIIGRVVKVLVNERKPAGFYQVEFEAGALSSGIYFYKLETRAYTATKKMIILR
jgi:Zn-dependent metalloprotease